MAWGGVPIENIKCTRLEISLLEGFKQFLVDGVTERRLFNVRAKLRQRARKGVWRLYFNVIHKAIGVTDAKFIP
jgi:hypothetical protein